MARPIPEDIWRFSPYFDLNIYRFFKERLHPRRTAFQLVLFAAILFAEFLRETLRSFYPTGVFSLTARKDDMLQPHLPGHRGYVRLLRSSRWRFP